MSSVFPVNTTALLILQQPSPLARSVGDSLADTGGVSGLAGTGAGSPLTLAQVKISDMFSVNRVDPTAEKVRLIERLGEEFGIRQSDYTSMVAYGADIRRAVEALIAKPGSSLVILQIEKRLGLDKLGISLDELVNATIDPNGHDGKKLDAALKKQVGDGGKSEGFSGPLQFDEIGLYGR
ncbi:hypothetical protein BPNPMPFG_001898 [Mesorhizobium sp. AR07]|uniref:hypothetical protein n=1 Tax=Mesorhizobium sp. AR07 TaxID=2865838 RepID=UPI00215F0B6F|nr:hypothetical protein [Mesorhizobium sp. AR07]UVK46274.1 hypothetical protein BPNPMPFG_001898 [Mesorhizobium sp. AR07]